MKNKGMHQQPNAFTPSTGGSMPKNVNKSGFQPAPHNAPNAQQSWNKPHATPAATHTPAPVAGGKEFKKGGKKAA